MNPTHTCPACHAPLPANAPEGLCPQCLIKAAAAPLPGDIIDIGDPAEVAKCLPQFEILEMLGRGGMGVVYKACQKQLDRIVALKILPPAYALSPDFVTRFSREARALAKLNHANIVHVYDYGETRGLYYIVMEFVDGANLRELFEARKLTPAEALAIVPKICDALEYAHEEGLVPLAFNCLTEHVPQWPVFTAMWIGMPVCVWTVRVLFRDDVREAFAAERSRQRDGSSKKGASDAD